MSSVIEQYAKQEAEKAAENAKHATLADVARKLLDTGKLTPQEVAESTGLSIENVYELCEPQQA